MNRKENKWMIESFFTELCSLAHYISEARRNTVTQRGSSIPACHHSELICNTNKWTKVSIYTAQFWSVQDIH
jgi:hypothetical protein